MNARFAPIVPSCPEPRSPSSFGFAERLEPAVVQPDYAAMDETSDWAQTMPSFKPTDIDARMEWEDAEEVEELLSQAPVPTPNGKWMGLALDACAELHILKGLIGKLDFFSAGDTGLGRLQQENEHIDAILQRAGYRNENAEASHG